MRDHRDQLYSIVIAIDPDQDEHPADSSRLGTSGAVDGDWRSGHISVDWVDFTREKAVEHLPSPRLDPFAIMSEQNASPKAGSSRRRSGPQRNVPGSRPPAEGSTAQANGSAVRRQTASDPDTLSMQPLLAHFPGPNPLDSSTASGVSQVGRGVVHLFRHAPPAPLIASLDAHPIGESSRSAKEAGDWAGGRAEGEDGSLVAILAVPAWMRPADFLEFIGGWSTCLEGVRMIRRVSLLWSLFSH